MLDLLRGPVTLSPSAIRTDGGTQARLRIDPATIAEYTEAMQAGAMFPPVVVYYDGADYWLADGFHRLAAWGEAKGDAPIFAEIRQGTRRDAVLCAVGSNASHGLRRTNEDKRNAVLTLLRDEEWGKWSDREIARVAQVSREYVNRTRNSGPVTGDRSQVTYTTKHGTTATMQTDNIGKPSPAPGPPPTARCARCGRELTDPAAVSAGIGACCARKPTGGGDEDRPQQIRTLRGALSVAVGVLETAAPIAEALGIDDLAEALAMLRGCRAAVEILGD